MMRRYNAGAKTGRGYQCEIWRTELWERLIELADQVAGDLKMVCKQERDSTVIAQLRFYNVNIAKKRASGIYHVGKPPVNIEPHLEATFERASALARRQRQNEPLERPLVCCLKSQLCSGPNALPYPALAIQLNDRPYSTLPVTSLALNAARETI